MFIYFSGLNGGYYFDDSHVLIDNNFVKVEALEVADFNRSCKLFYSGWKAIKYVVLRVKLLSFGDSTWWFKLVNLLIHCLNGLGLYILCKQLFVCNVRDNSLCHWFFYFY